MFQGSAVNRNGMRVTFVILNFLVDTLRKKKKQAKLILIIYLSYISKMSSFQHVIRIEVILYFFILSLSNLVSYTYSTSQFRWATYQVLNIASGYCIGQQKYRTFLSQQNFLVDSALPGSPYFTNSRLREPHREHCFIVQDADDRPFCIHTHLPPHCYLIILIYPHSQMG